MKSELKIRALLLFSLGEVAIWCQRHSRDASLAKIRAGPAAWCLPERTRGSLIVISQDVTLFFSSGVSISLSLSCMFIPTCFHASCKTVTHVRLTCLDVTQQHTHTHTHILSASQQRSFLLPIDPDDYKPEVSGAKTIQTSTWYPVIDPVLTPDTSKTGKKPADRCFGVFGGGAWARL